MDLKPTKPLSGFIELLPAQQRCFDFCAARMLNVLKKSGFNLLDLPAIERAEVLTDKDNWDEIETQMFLFQKRTDPSANGGRGDYPPKVRLSHLCGWSLKPIAEGAR